MRPTFTAQLTRLQTKQTRKLVSLGEANAVVLTTTTMCTTLSPYRKLQLSLTFVLARLNFPISANFVPQACSCVCARAIRAVRVVLRQCLCVASIYQRDQLALSLFTVCIRHAAHRWQACTRAHTHTFTIVNERTVRASSST